MDPVLKCQGHTIPGKIRVLPKEALSGVENLIIWVSVLAISVLFIYRTFTTNPKWGYKYF